MHRITRFFFVSLYLISGLQFGSLAQQTHQQLIKPINYLLSLPDGYGKDSTQKWPLMIFLHGSGESGNDLEKVKVHGPAKLIEQGKKFPFIVVSPQAPDARFGWIVEDLYFLLQECKKKYQVDPDRIYLTGLSMGGFGTWAFAISHPEEFAAIVPICGGGDTADIWKLRNMPVWCFHGGKDSTVPLERDREMIGALKQYNPNVRFTVYPELGHNSWTVTYENDSLYRWLLAQRKFTYKEVPVESGVLKQYVGLYVGYDDGQADTVKISMEGDKVYAKTNKESFALKSASADIFFLDPHIPADIRFGRNPEGKVTGFVVYDNKRLKYKRIMFRSRR